MDMDRNNLTITPQQLAAGHAGNPLLSSGADVDVPMLTVDLDGPFDLGVATRAAVAAKECDRLLVGLRRRRGEVTQAQRQLANALDTSFSSGAEVSECSFVPADDPEAAVGELRAAVHRNVHASMILGRVLRLSERMSVPDALDVESLAYSTLLGGPEFRRWLDQRGPRPLPPPSPQPPVLVLREAEGLRITLNRPERRNAYGAEVRDGLVAALELAVLDDTLTAVQIDGSGSSFCAGGDLDEFGTTPDLATAHLIRTRAGAGRLVARLADRIEVRVHGSCVGAGIEVPAFAGRIVADPGAIFRLPEVSMGLVPGAGGTVSVPRRVGRWRAFWMCVTGVGLDVVTALDWGLVDEIASRPTI